MIRKLVVVPVLFIVSLAVGQTSISFYHLGNATFQNSGFNPAWMPEGKFFIGLPGLSGVHVNVNNKLNYSEMFTKEDNQVILNIDRALPKLQRQNMLSFQTDINIFHFGYRFPGGTTLSLLVNERFEADLLYSKKLIEFIWRGNFTQLGDNVQLGDAGFRASHFREIGLSLSRDVNDRFRAGGCLKYLVGFLDISTPGNFKANLTTDSKFFQLNGELQNSVLRRSGLNIYRGNKDDLGSHLTFNSNTGFALDIGGVYKHNRSISIAGSIQDIGWISWKTDIDNRTLNDTTFTYRGINLRGVSDIEQDLKDSLLNRFNPITTADVYKSWLPLKAYGSWIYHYDNKTDVYVTIATRHVLGKFKMLYGGGVTRRFEKGFTGSLSATKLPQQFFNIGAAFAVKTGSVQYYMAADQIVNFDVTKTQAIDFRLGINFVFSEKGEKWQKSGSDTSAGSKEGSDTSSFLGVSVKNKRREGIYSIIQKQKKREIKPAKLSGKKKIIRHNLSKRRKISP